MMIFNSIFLDPICESCFNSSFTTERQCAYPGNDIPEYRDLETPFFEDCVTLCSGDASCTAVVFHERDGGCFLKHTADGNCRFSPNTSGRLCSTVPECAGEPNTGSGDNIDYPDNIYIEGVSYEEAPSNPGILEIIKEVASEQGAIFEAPSRPIFEEPSRPPIFEESSEEPIFDESSEEPLFEEDFFNIESIKVNLG